MAEGRWQTFGREASAGYGIGNLVAGGGCRHCDRLGLTADELVPLRISAFEILSEFGFRISGFPHQVC